MTSSSAFRPPDPVFDPPSMRLAAENHPAVAPTLPQRCDVQPGLLAVGAFALGMSLRVNLGQYDPAALRWLLLAAVVTAVGVLRGRSAIVARLNRWCILALPVLAAGMAVLLIGDSPLATVQPPLARFQVLMAAGAAGMLFASVGRARVARWGIGLMILAQFGAGLWTVRVAPQTSVDVCTFQRESSEALLHGHNPYALTFDDPFESTSGFYGEGLSKNGRLQFGYPYLPLPLFMVLPGHLLGDFRLAMMGAMAISIALLAAMRPGRIAPLAAGLLLFTPRGLFVLEAGWIEPLVVLLLAAVTFAACHYRPSRNAAIILGILVGLLFASKQYLVVIAPALWLLPVVRDRVNRWAFLIATIASACVVTLPLALWNPKAFMWSAAILQFHQPFRPDALSLLVPLGKLLQTTPPAWIAWIALLLAPAVALGCALRLKPGAANFAGAVALTLIVFFAINKQAFCNYYYLVIGALACAVAASDVRSSTRAVPIEMRVVT